jgi:DNA repair exonuclease SbcCD nuclease subunit
MGPYTLAPFFSYIMKILFTADWHIKLGQKNVPKDWQINRYELLLNYLNSENVDLIIIGGDIFDRIPSLDELNLYFNIISKLNSRVLIYSGNHEILGKDATFLSKLKTWTAYINKEAKIIDRYEVFDDFSILPYNELKQFADNPSKYKNTTQILFTHVRGEIPPYVVPEIPLNLFSKWKTVFAGDLHSHSNSQLNIVYPGSPLTTSFHREEITTGYILLDTETLNWEWKEIKLPQLIRLTVNDPSKMLPTDFNHTIYEIVGTIQDLAKIEKHDLLDKKITPINSTNRLNFSKNMKIQDELNLYLMEVLKMSKEDSIELINIYNAYITDEMV